MEGNYWCPREDLLHLPCMSFKKISVWTIHSAASRALKFCFDLCRTIQEEINQVEVVATTCEIFGGDIITTECLLKMLVMNYPFLKMVMNILGGVPLGCLDNYLRFRPCCSSLYRCNLQSILNLQTVCPNSFLQI